MLSLSLSLPLSLTIPLRKCLCLNTFLVSLGVRGNYFFSNAQMDVKWYKKISLQCKLFVAKTFNGKPVTKEVI